MPCRQNGRLRHERHSETVSKRRPLDFDVRNLPVDLDRRVHGDHGRVETGPRAPLCLERRHDGLFTGIAITIILEQLGSLFGYASPYDNNVVAAFDLLRNLPKVQNALWSSCACAAWITSAALS
jgi:hypothetical protein